MAVSSTAPWPTTLRPPSITGQRTWDSHPSGGWWVSRTRLEMSLLAVVGVSLFLLIAVCLAMAAVITGTSRVNLLTDDYSPKAPVHANKFKRSLPEVNDETKSHEEILINPDWALRLQSQSQTGAGLKSMLGDEDSVTILEAGDLARQQDEDTTTKPENSVSSSTPSKSNEEETTSAPVPELSTSSIILADKNESKIEPSKSRDPSIEHPSSDNTAKASNSSASSASISDTRQNSKLSTTPPSISSPNLDPNSDSVELLNSSSSSTSDSSSNTTSTVVSASTATRASGSSAIIAGTTRTADTTPSNSSCSMPTDNLIAASGICLTKGCVSSASELIDNMDDSVEPCNDFFEYACGNYLKSKNIPDEKSSISQFSAVSDVLQEKLRTLVESKDPQQDTESSLMVKQLYKSCMNTDRIAEQGLQPLKDILRQMGGWPAVEGPDWQSDRFDWVQNIYINRRLGYSVDLLFDFSITTNIKNSSWRIIDIDQPSLGMPSREYLLRGLNDSDVQAYLEYQVSLATLLGADRAYAESQLRQSLEFEIKLANFSLPKEERRNATKLYNKMTIADLQSRVPNIPWLTYINTILAPFTVVTEREEVIVNVPSYIDKLGNLLRTAPKQVVANYMMWRISAASISYLSEDARDLQLVYSKKITGTGKRKPRWKECMGAVSGSLSYAVGKLYAEKFFKKDAKNAADEMVSYIRTEFDKILRTVDWMDDKTRIRAINKSMAITPHIAYPEELLDESKLTELYKELVISDGELLHNMRNLTIFGTNYSFKRLREKVDKNDWKKHGAAAVVNAFYSPLENSIQFPAGILQGTFFNADRPKYLNYGAIGFVIGHEITHGFDDMGRQFDYKGDLKEWWEPETRAKFLEKSKCIIHQYGNYTAPEVGLKGRQFDYKGDLKEWWEPETRAKFLEKSKCIIHQYGNYTAPEVGLKLNGVNTQGENIADNGGIKEAYYAYLQYVKDYGEELTLPALGLSTKQLFWLSAANVWCGKYRPETLKLRILTGAHSPARFRVNGPLSNLPEFARDWNCKPSSKMNPPHKCSVW
ncbi:Peptidase M13 C-terminal domain [Trinorchestia longiramus]|nr:Peptidase M13 C-terminal domain [Trinorchestia longiramus]